MQIGEYQDSHEIQPDEEPVPKDKGIRPGDMPPPEIDKGGDEEWVS